MPCQQVLVILFGTSAPYSEWTFERSEEQYLAGMGGIASDTLPKETTEQM
ncbi:hypothetical protein [Lactococcus lactis]|nr:hypothetical protein [Lactococcus lactis]